MLLKSARDCSHAEGGHWTERKRGKRLGRQRNGEKPDLHEVEGAPKKRIKVEQEICGNKGSKKLVVSQRPQQRFL